VPDEPLPPCAKTRTGKPPPRSNSKSTPGHWKGRASPWVTLTLLPQTRTTWGQPPSAVQRAKLASITRAVRAPPPAKIRGRARLLTGCWKS